MARPPCLQSRRRAPILTAPPDDQEDPSTKISFTVCHETAAAAAATETGAVLRGGSDVTNVAIEEKHSDHSIVHSMPLGSCRRIGLRKVGKGSSRDLPKNNTASSHVCQKSHGYRPPTAPGFMMGFISGDVSNYRCNVVPMNI